MVDVFYLVLVLEPAQPLYEPGSMVGATPCSGAAFVCCAVCSRRSTYELTVKSYRLFPDDS